METENVSKGRKNATPRRSVQLDTRIEKISPSQATKWLETTEDVPEFRNRAVSDQNVALWARAMLNGEWETNHQGIAIFRLTDGREIVIDGQHRLFSIVMAAVSVTMQVTYYSGTIDEAIEIMRSFDRGQKRNLGQVLKITRGTTRGTTRASACRYLIAFLLSGGKADYAAIRQITDVEILTAVERYSDSLDWFVTLKRSQGNVFLSAPVAAALIYAHQSLKYREAVEKFGRQLSGGEGLFAGDPALSFREWILNTPGGSDSLLRRPEGRMKLMRIAFKAIHRAVVGKPITRFDDDMTGFEFFRGALNVQPTVKKKD